MPDRDAASQDVEGLPCPLKIGFRTFGVMNVSAKKP